MRVAVWPLASTCPLVCSWQPCESCSCITESLFLSFPLYHSSTGRKGPYSSILSSAISAASLNWAIAPDLTSQRAAYWAHSGRISISSQFSVLQARTRPTLSCLGQCNRTCRTVCACQPHGQCGVISGTWTDASQAFRPITSVRIRKRAVASAFERPAYSLRVSCSQGVLYMRACDPARCCKATACHFLCHTCLPQSRIRAESFWASRGRWCLRPDPSARRLRIAASSRSRE
jgi:hypothetical protein